MHARGARQILQTDSSQRFSRALSFPSLQKCSRFHALELFEGGKRTCIKMLELQNSRRRAPDAEPKAEEHLATSAQATSWALPEGGGPEAGCLRVLLHPHRAQEAPPHPWSTPAAAAAAAPDLLFAAAQRTPRPGEVQLLLASQLARSSTGGESASALHPSQVLLQHLHHRLAPAPQPLLPADAPLQPSDVAAKAIAAALAVVQPQEPSLPQKQHAQPGAHPPADIVAAAVVCLSAPDGGVDGAAQALARYVLSSFMRVPE